MSGRGLGQRLIQIGDDVVAHPRSRSTARTTSGAAPAVTCASSDSWRWVVEAEWMTRLRVSPRFATWLNSFSVVDQLDAGLIAALDREGEQRPGALRA